MDLITIPFSFVVLRQRLRAVMQPDAHAVDGRYRIRSLYFDTPEDRALREKLDGVSDQWTLKTVWGVGYKFEVKDS